MKIRNILLAVGLGTLFPMFTLNAVASGIPVVDSAAIKTAVTNSIKELAEMSKQLVEAQKQLEQMKANVKALTEFKGFTDSLQNGGLLDEVTSSFEDLMTGSPADLISKSEQYFDMSVSDKCENIKDSSLCEKAALSGIAQLDFAEKLEKQIQTKIERISELSEKAQKTEDMKSIAELQASIQLEGNSIALIKHQMDNFDRLQEAQKEIASRQAQERYAARQWDGFGKDSGQAAQQKEQLLKLSELIN